MTLLTDRITDHRDADDLSADPPYYAAFVTHPSWTSPNERYVATVSPANIFCVSVADLDALTIIQNFNIGFVTIDSELTPSVSSLDTHAACIDDAGSLWMAAGEGTGEMFELTLGHLDTPIYRFTLASGGGGDPYWFNRASRAFAMPDDTTKVLFVEYGTGSSALVYDYHLWDKDAETYGHVTLTFRPFCSFQDDNGDIWLCGVDSHSFTESITTAYFKRITDVTGDSPYPAEQTFTGLPDLAHSSTGGNITGIWGGFADGYFVGGWTYGSPATENLNFAPRCDYLLRLKLDGSGDFTTANILGTAPEGLAWSLPQTAIPVGSSILSLALITLETDPLATPTLKLGDQRKFGHFSTATLSLSQSYDLDDWAAGDDHVSDMDGLIADALGDQYLYTLQAFMAQSKGTKFYEPDNPDEPLQQVGKLWLYYLGEAPDTGDDDGDDDDTTIRCWGFSLDDHDIGVFRLGASETLIVDLKTKQWAEWRSPNRTNFRAHVGCNWVGMTETLADGGTDVVAGDDVTGVLWRLDPAYGLDDNTTTGSESFPRRVTGQVPLDGRETLSCGALTLAVALGAPSQTGAAVTLSTSDNLGHSWLSHGSQTVTALDYNAVIEWRGLGLARAPGRLFAIEDDGATVRIGRADLR